MSAPCELGSPQWADSVFASLPARDIKSEGRWAIRHAPKFDGQAVWTEGGIEVLAAYWLEYFSLRRVVRRWKAQPFRWLPPGAQEERIPDFLFELDDGRLGVAQVKSKKYLTPLIQSEFDEEIRYAREHGMLHLLWTDEFPLNRELARLFFGIRRARNTPYDQQELNALVAAVKEAGQVTVLDLIALGHPPSLLEIGIRQGRIFVNILESLNEQSVVASKPLIDERSFFLGTRFDAQSWWNSLSSAERG